MVFDSPDSSWIPITSRFAGGVGEAHQGQQGRASLHGAASPVG